MGSSIGPGDPAYEAAMREAKALFDAAMAQASTKRGGRPRGSTNAARASTEPDADAADEAEGADAAGDLAHADDAPEGERD
jgi:hypothetical protein